ncbi:hypothetical protein [Serratia sarumanii]|uniref:hypothetical protein n=1 Tax=Serratia sarumanii TaxID=3020826 RepID=UPI003F81C9DD
MIGLELTELEAKKLAGGDGLSLNGKRWRAGADGTIQGASTNYAEKCSKLMARIYDLAHNKIK